MTNEKIVDIMKQKVEEIVRNKMREDFNETKQTDRKNVSKIIIQELEKVMQDEN